MDKSGRINLRINPEIKERCEKIAKESGISLSALINSFLTSLAHRGKAPFVTLAQARSLETSDQILPFAEIYSVVNQVLSPFDKNKVKKAYLFGSYSRGEAKKTSDVDILIEPGEEMTLFDLGRINGELSEKLGKNVDTVASIESLDPRMVDGVLRDREILYEASER